MAFRMCRDRLDLPWSLTDSTPFYYFVLVFAAVGTLLLVRIVASPFGHALRGIRESETRMLALGYNVWRYKLVAFVLAATLPGSQAASTSTITASSVPTTCTWRARPKFC
jgi:branched-chain amino acid transport system permease protein